jgi:hypothetical protein
VEKLKSEVVSVRLEEKLSACTANLIANQKLEAKMEENCSANLKTHQDLKSQMEETFENLQGLIQYKLEEIEKLRDELEAS